MICRIRAKVLGKQNDNGKLDLKGNLLCEDYFFDLQANVNEWLKFNKNLYSLNFLKSTKDEVNLQDLDLKGTIQFH